MVKRLIRIYTPFICAITAIIHGVISLGEYEVVLGYYLSEFTGHSLLVLLYILATCRRMCKWYKITVYLLMSVHALNIIYLLGGITYYSLLCSGLVINILAVICFLIFRLTRGVSKIVC